MDARTEQVDCIVLGRKVVISNSLTESPWENAVLAETVNRLKACVRPAVRLRDHRVALRAEALLNTRNAGHHLTHGDRRFGCSER
ncbi:hypothetical protein [Actinophytocola sp.]|uniref:hypothetical protein n=1 Tax=Actinophytocola sp. TaxID=1872138 RepID=UPI002ED9FE33